MAVLLMANVKGGRVRFKPNVQCSLLDDGPGRIFGGGSSTYQRLVRIDAEPGDH